MTDAEELEELRKENAKLTQDNEKMETDLEDLADELQDAKDELEESTAPYIALLERFADHGNWTGNAWTPVFKGTDEHPADMAGRCLRTN